MIVPRDADPGLRVCAQAWAEGLREAGLEVSSADAVDASRDATAVIVAPHAALRPLAHDPLRIAGLLQRAVCLSTSRLGSGALGADRPFHSAASASVGLSRDASLYLSAHGAPTAHLKPGSHPQLRAHVAAERRVAVGVHARYSSYREDLIARSRGVLDPYACDLRVSHSAETHPPEHLDGDDWLSWLTSVDVLVSLPPEAGPGTDWCELAPAVLNGAVVVTTAESDFAPLEPGEEIAAATSAGFADSLRRLLADDERRERMRSSALRSPRGSSSRRHATRGGDRLGQARQPSRAAVRVRSSGPATGARRGAPRVRCRGGSRCCGGGAHAPERERSNGADQTTTSRGWDDLPAPALSVVIPSYDQAAFVAAAVESALAAADVELEVVVVDDCSTDESAAVLRALLEGHDGRALKLVVHGDNEGLSAARNRGFLEARAPLVLLLDADDELLPHGPAALHRALEADPEAAFAYGLLARVGLERQDLLGTAPWDPVAVPLRQLRAGDLLPRAPLGLGARRRLLGRGPARARLGGHGLLAAARRGRTARRPRPAHRRHLSRAWRLDEHPRQSPRRCARGVHARASPRPDGRRMTPDELLTHLEAELARCRDERDRLSAELEATRAERDEARSGRPALGQDAAEVAGRSG